MRITAVKQLLLVVSLTFLPAVLSGAATVSILIIETGVETGSGAASVWESGMMDVFFDAGYIVSNSPALRILTEDDEVLSIEARRGFEEADRGGADYFVVTRLDYAKGKVNGIQRPERISLQLYKINPYGVLYDKNFKSDSSTSETFLEAKNAAMLLTQYIRGGS
jgi:hypothetical protein